MPTFRLGINMAGAVSAGAYTAGVLDFLTEALDEWYKARQAGAAVPAHDISIEVLTGASAGGMCAAISAVMLQEDFEHIHLEDLKPGDLDSSRITSTIPTGTSNRFYEAWVNQIDIRELLKANDLRGDKPNLVSLLDSSIITSIAQLALTPSSAPPKLRPYLSPDLALFLSLTNLRGVPYSLNGAAPGSIEETTFFYGDRAAFQTVRSDSRRKLPPNAHPVPLNQPAPAGEDWDFFRTAAVATGAFPVFLAPRVLSRHWQEYNAPAWETAPSKVAGTPPPTPPTFPLGLPNPFQTVNVDGGVTNNDPYNYAHDFLHSNVFPPAPECDPAAADDRLTVDRAVIGIAPFPTTEQYSTDYKTDVQCGIFKALPSLFSALLSQSRFFGESLSRIMQGATFSRFIIAPSDAELVTAHEAAVAANPAKPPAMPAALQCASLGAFGGFFERGFRAHDFALGRRNCQKFLMDSFVLPVDNVVMREALAGLDAGTRAAVLKAYARPAPGPYHKEDTGGPAATPGVHEQLWLPIVPLCSLAVSTPMLNPIPRARISKTNLDQIVDLVMSRFKVVLGAMLAKIPSKPLRFFLQLGQPVIRALAKGPLTDTLVNHLGDAYDPKV